MVPQKKAMRVVIEDERYEADDGSTLAREEGETPWGEPIGRYWVYRDAGGHWIDYDQYRHDIASRRKLNLHADPVHSGM